jgi:hypothetical protein
MRWSAAAAAFELLVMWTSEIKARITSFGYQLFTEATISVHPTVKEPTGGRPKNDHVPGPIRKMSDPAAARVQGASPQ